MQPGRLLGPREAHQRGLDAPGIEVTGRAVGNVGGVGHGRAVY